MVSLSRLVDVYRSPTQGSVETTKSFATSMHINLYCTHRNPPELEFPHELRGRRDATDLGLLEHLREFLDFVMGHGDREMTQLLYRVCRHIQRVNHHFSIETDEDQLNGVAQWAVDANAILILEDGAVRGPTGLVLVDLDGSADEGAEVPFPADAVNRKLQHEDWLTEQQIPFNINLPPVVGKDELQLREPKDVAQRTLALLVCALRAESIATGEEFSSLNLDTRMQDGFANLSPNESEFMTNHNPDQQAVMRFGYRYECVYVLQWVLGMHDSLNFPTSICDVPLVARTVFQHDPSELIEQAKLRDAEEVLDELDMHFRLLWTAREEAFGDSKFDTELDLAVLQERCVALNWLTFFERADWDDVDCPA